MKIGGLQKFSMIDYPDKIACIVFTQGCNFRCPYCHNPELVKPEMFGESLSEEEFFDFLKERVGKLDAVSITGGEPTLQYDLIEFIKKIRDLGFLIKLDTNGTNPDMLKEIIDQKLVNYLAMDIKAPFSKYEEITKMPVNIEKIKQSVEMIKSSGIDYEFRTTLVKKLLSPEDIEQIGRDIAGAKQYFLQKFVSTKTVDEKVLNEETYSEEELENLKERLKPFVAKCLSR
ncbi:MAG TPA: anaerobic ribonucleoside-triphosphate reductase activating protein [Candidatus Magasanikbacteria bacterium]|nr:anaerobic ribonucleoside-triphosphate reductase activating protein [Candidatus Magasanikbacteria bacterium]